MSFLNLAKARYSCRKISDKPVEDEKINQILQAGIAAPTATNAQPYKIWAFKSEEAMNKLKQTTNFTFGANIALLVGGKKTAAWTRPSDNENFATVDAAIVATHFLLAIQDVGLATTWVGKFDAPKLKELFPDMADYELVALFPIGYAADDAKPSPRHEDRRSMNDAVVNL